VVIGIQLCEAYDKKDLLKTAQKENRRIGSTAYGKKNKGMAEAKGKKGKKE